MLKRLFFLILITHAYAVWGQSDFLTGVVTDSLTHEPLAFVSIVYNHEGQGVVTNMDGLFRIPRSHLIQFVQLRYVGYRTKTVPVQFLANGKKLILSLSPESTEIDEVIVYPAENPAHRIIELAIANRDKNNPEKSGPFSFVAYDKMIFDVASDSGKSTAEGDTTRSTIRELPDSIPYGMDGKGRMDVKQILEKQYLFMMETISQRTFFSSQENQEKIIASKVSGISQPSLMFMVRQFQSFSFYNDFVAIANKQFLNPLSSGSTDRYLFLIEDTAYTAFGDTVFIISFRPRKGRNFDGMKGVLYINSNGYAVQNVLAEANDGADEMIRVAIQQQYEHVNGLRWFPVMLNTTLYFNASQYGNRSLPFDIVGTGKSYLMNINFDPPYHKDDFSSVAVEVSPGAHKQTAEVWDAYRTDSLSSREIETYRVIDSIGKAEHLDRTVTSFETLLTGYLPGQYWNFDITKFLGYNHYEGLRLGLGGRTTENVSKVITLGGYLAYGFKDKNFKYGANLTLNVIPSHEIGVTLLHRNDVRESGGIHFNESWNLSGTAFIRNYLIKNMDITKDYELSLSFRALKFLTGQTYFCRSYIQPTGDYRYSISDDNPQVLLTEYIISEAGVRLKYAYGETFMKTPRGNKFSMGTKFPVIYYNTSRGLDLWNSTFMYWRHETKITKTFQTKAWGSAHLTLITGMVSSKVPYCKLFAGMGSYRAFTFEAEQSFGTMRMNEFLSNRFIALFYKHDFGNLLFKPRGNFQPELAFVQNIGFGRLSAQEHHENILVRTMEKGYFESGLLINNLLKVQIFKYGLGVFYRYGPYGLSRPIDNFAFKMTLQFNMQ